MQATVMAPVLGPGFPPQVPSQSYSPYETHPDPLTSPAPSAHPIRPPPPQPAYPTLNYPPQNGWMFPTNYFQPQPRYTPPPFYQNGLGQMGGPGPGTMRNGYRAFQPDEYQPPFRQNGYAQPPQGYLSPPDTHHPFDSEPLKPGFPIENQSLPQQPQPPQMLNGYNRGPTYTPIPNGHASPPPPQSSFQPFYPPDHPYAHGGGFGYSPFLPGPGMTYGNGYGGYADVNEVLPLIPQQALSGSRSLNPAAQGFSFTPLQTGPGGLEHADRPLARPDEMPVFASIEPQYSTPVAANGFPDSEKQGWAAPIMVDGEKLKGIGERRQSGDLDQGSSVIGLTHLAPVDPTAGPPLDFPAIPSSAPVSTATTLSISTPAMSSSPTTPTTPVSVQTPRITSDIQNAAVPMLEIPSPVQADDAQWSFVGPSMSGSTSSASNGTAMVAPPSLLKGSASSSVLRRRVPVSTEVTPLRLRPNRPEADSTAENAYSSSLSIAIPKAVRIEQVAVDGDVPRLSTKGKGKASGKRIIFATGIDAEDQAKMGVKRTEGSSLVFGSLMEGLKESLSSSALMAPSADVSAPTLELTPTVPLAPSKPTSWASLFNSAGKPFSRSSSIPSSMVVSPSKSVMSLATESEAATSRVSTEPTTPRSTALTLPASTGASVASAPRPVFNYAAAAAAGVNLTPQEELSKILTDGLRSRHKDTPMCLPRGLINTGNMCFANTILQVLVYCPPFTDLFDELRKRLKADLSGRTPLLESMIAFLREFTPNSPSQMSMASRSSSSIPNGSAITQVKPSDPRKKAFIPENVYDAVKDNKRFDSMRRGYQEDAEEYLGFFLNTLHEEMLVLLSRTRSSRPNGAFRPNGDVDREIERPISPGADGAGWLEVGKRQRTNVVRSAETRESAVSRLFGGTIRSVLHTPGQKDSVTLEPYQPLQLDVQSSEVLTISDALRHISQPETVLGVWSAARGSNVDATKQVYIETFPPVLILHLKRFVYDGAEQSVVKRSKPVAYGVELIIPPEIVSPGRRTAAAIKYKLFGVVYHHGTSASGGHYTVSVARQDAEGWIHFDDETYEPVSSGSVVVSREEAEEAKAGLIGGREKCAYLLFYQRIRA